MKIVNRIKRILLIINYKTLIITALSIASTYLCLRYQWIANFPLTLIATAIVFPIVFSIGSAYKRRETALKHYAEIKGNGHSLYLSVRDWLEKEDPEATGRMRGSLSGFMTSFRTLLIEPVEQLRRHEAVVYGHFSELSRLIKEDLRHKGLAATEISRCNQYLSKMIIAFEGIKHIYQYRTPRNLRAFSDFFITLLPLLYGPYFAYLAGEYSHGLEYAMPILFSFVLVSLYNIQEHLENPFDQIGIDDIDISVERYVDRLK